MADNKLVSAEDMRRAVAQDPQFNAPVRPALCRGLVVVPFTDGILVEGGPTRQVLRGAATRELIPNLLPLLDGTRDAAEVAGLADVPVQHVEQALALLYTCGLLEEGASAGDPAGDTPAAVFLSRNLDSTRVNRNASEVLQRLRSTRVTVIGDGETGALLRQSLIAAGFTQVSQGSDTPEGEPDFVVAVGDGVETDLRAVGRWCAARGIPMLPAHLRGSTLDLGPYIDPAFTVSYDDVERQRAAATAAKQQDSTRNEAAARTMAIAMITNQVTSIVGRVGSTVVLRGLVRTDLDAWQQDLYVMAPVPEQADNRSALTTAGVPLALMFETSVGFPPRKLLNPRDHQVHYKPGNVALQHESKRWPSAYTLALPTEGVLPQAPLEPATPPVVDQLDLSHLASLLLVSAGRKDEAGSARSVPRWSPTGGNLGSVTLHAVVRDVTGVPSGMWGYDATGHRLAQLPAAMDLARLPGAGSSATIVFTGALARVASKYSTFAWRIVHLDAGVAIAQLVHAARALGISARPMDRWDDSALAAAFDLDLDAEPITGVLELRPFTTDEA
ncbi:nitroreductase family protein [Streptomyces sp. NBC_01363]|uniref:nitroreductase family protein n=1 Tax=Streptomyces sp. NBC_01363 TaxID=2903840 RepID=UPI002256FBEE|nr:nitroreductase family protein [Streptomyces sp. NBC_01363]MCX4731503.1 nitroreductase family protein [Streptomyces sp. NBC_01363]